MEQGQKPPKPPRPPGADFEDALSQHLEPCPKCDRDHASVTWHRSNMDCGAFSKIRDSQPTLTEHLHLTCIRCAFEWTAVPLDASTSQSGLIGPVHD